MVNSILSNNNIYVENNQIGFFTDTPVSTLDVQGDINCSSAYYINDTSVLSSTTLGTSVINSSLQTVGILNQLQVNNGATFQNIYTNNLDYKSGIQGYQGLLGFQGVVGDVGNQGILGYQGVVGDVGNQGLGGNQGNQGISGTIIGNQGFRGFQGIRGFQGYNGVIGRQGYMVSGSTFYGLTVTCGPLTTNATAFKPTPFSWSAVSSPFGTTYNNITYSVSTLTIPASGVYSFTVWFLGSATVLVRYYTYLSVDNGSITQNGAITGVRFNNTQPYGWNSVIYLSAGSKVELGLSCSLTSNSILGASNKVYLHCFKIL